ncbi:MAG: glutathione S-transferase family protein [Burkholderiales bacterium]
MLLYEHPLSPYAQKVRIALREKGLPFEARQPPGMGAGQDRSGLAALTPRIELPVLLTEGAKIFDSTVILEYIEDRHPVPPLRPATPLARARARMIEEVCDTHYEAINWGLIELQYFGRGGPELGAQLRARAEEQIGHLHAWLARLLGDHAWLHGEAFGWADMAVVPFVWMSEMLGIPPQPDSPLASWLQRTLQRPSVAATVAEAQASVPTLARAAHLLKGGAFKRQYRDHRLEWMVRSGGVQVLLDGLANGDIRFTDTDRFIAHTLVLE